ncbi:thioredoxin [Lentimicrobium sp. S6]|uniref:thioredoxin n=1 Tax=Lentimicrobium sp. S6 TaxID=2735872 RepID=UPI0020A6755F|nr:thioredoxin [Lentimicrobium sp. S6]
MIILETNWNLLTPVLLLAAIVLFLIVRMYKIRRVLIGGGGPETSENTIDLTDQTFEKVIGKGVSLVDFWAPWCAPCRMQGPIVNELADEIAGKANICKMDVDKNKKMAAKYGIRSIPTIMVFKNGVMVKQFVGIKPKATLLKEIEKHL